MKLKDWLPSAAISATLFVGISCGSDTNVNGLLFSGGDDETSITSLLAEARILYDEGKFTEALTLAEKAQELSPQSEQPALLIGYIHLSLAGLDPLNITTKLVKQSAGKEADTATSALTGNHLVQAESKSASDTLGQLASLLVDTNAEDLAQLGTKQTSEVSAFQEDPAAYDLLIPKQPGSLDDPASPRGSIAALVHLNKAILAICPFIKETALQDSDLRHNCTAAPGLRINPGKAHYLWGIAHLTEALYFSTVLLYKGGGDQATNLLNRVEGLKALSNSIVQEQNFAGLTDFVTVLTEFQGAIDAIFDTSDGSMLSAILSGLGTAALGFAAIPGIPSGVTDQIDQAIASITASADELSKQVDKVQGDTSGATDKVTQLQALKGQMNEKISTDVKGELDKISQTNPEKFEENKCKLCPAYSAISEGITNAGTPAGCVNFDATQCTQQ